MKYSAGRLISIHSLRWWWPQMKLDSRPHYELRSTNAITQVILAFWLVLAYDLSGPVHTSHFCRVECNRPRSRYQYSNMAPRLSGQTSIFGVVFFVLKPLLGIDEQKKLEKFAILTRKSRSHAWILIYRTWPIQTNDNEANHLIIYYLNCIQHGRNATYEPGLRGQMHYWRHHYKVFPS